MSNIAKFSATTAVSTGLADALADFAEDRPVQSSGLPFLKLRKNDGLWVYGQEQTECADDTEWMIGAMTIMQGFVDWHGGKPAGEKMAYVGQPKPKESELGASKGKNGWEAQVGFHLIGIGGEDDGKEIIWKTNTHGGVNQWNAIFDAIKARAGAGKTACNPIVALKETSYTHAEYGLIYKPDMRVLRWVDDEGNEEAAAVEDKSEDKPKATRKRRA